MSPAQKAKRLVIIAEQVDGARSIVDANTISASERASLGRLMAAVSDRLRIVAADTIRLTRDGAR